MKKVLLVLLVLAVLAGCFFLGSTETPYQNESFLEMQNLPSLQRMDEAEADQLVKPLQVMRKISGLNLKESDFIYPQSCLDDLDKSFKPIADRTWSEETFTGATGEELNTFLQQHPGKKIVVSSGEIEIKESIVVPNKTWLCANQTRLTGGGAFAAFKLEGSKSVGISGFVMDGCFDYGVYVQDSNDITVTDCCFLNLSRKPLVFVGNCYEIYVLRNRAEGNANGGLYFNGRIQRALIENNEIINNKGTSNWMAGIVLTAIDVSADRDIYAPFNEALHFPKEQRLDTMLDAPHNIVIRGNNVEENNSSGIYCDGPYNVYIVENHIIGNDKEGMCLDYGTIGTFVTRNDIMKNGNRARQTDEDLTMDFVFEHGRMADGSAKAKLPGVSIDNSAYNIVYDNRISENYGSGVKMVRAGVRNIISTNVLIGNNVGENDLFHFFGVEIGNAVADIEATNIDFTPGYENIICRNLITGKHYTGIFIDTDTFINDFFDNTIMDATHWSIECISDKFNSCVNNFSLVQSRGIPLSNTIAVAVGGWVK